MSIHIEGAETDSYENGIQHLYDFATRKDMGGYNYAFLMEEDDGTLIIVERLRMPCWGAIREYGCGTRPDDEWPPDLQEPRHIFPKTGNPVAISFQFCNIDQRDICGAGTTDAEWDRFMTEFVFNIEVSPWASILKDIELVMRDGLITGVLFKDTKIDPTVMANMMQGVGRAYHPYARNWIKWVDMGYHPLTAFLYTVKGSWMRIVPERYFNQDPFDYTGGTFYDRYSYTRPYVERIFGGKDNVGVIINNFTIEQIEELRLSIAGNLEAAV